VLAWAAARQWQPSAAAAATSGQLRAPRTQAVQVRPRLLEAQGAVDAPAAVAPGTSRSPDPSTAQAAAAAAAAADLSSSAGCRQDQRQYMDQQHYHDQQPGGSGGGMLSVSAGSAARVHRSSGTAAEPSIARQESSDVDGSSCSDATSATRPRRSMEPPAVCKAETWIVMVSGQATSSLVASFDWSTALRYFSGSDQSSID